MSETLLTIEDAARCLPALVERIHNKGEEAVLLKSGKPFVRIVPVKPGDQVSNDLIAFLHEWRVRYPQPDDQLAESIEDSRKANDPPRDPWE